MDPTFESSSSSLFVDPIVQRNTESKSTVDGSGYPVSHYLNDQSSTLLASAGLRSDMLCSGESEYPGRASAAHAPPPTLNSNTFTCRFNAQSNDETTDSETQPDPISPVEEVLFDGQPKAVASSFLTSSSSQKMQLSSSTKFTDGVAGPLLTDAAFGGLSPAQNAAGESPLSLHQSQYHNHNQQSSTYSTQLNQHQQRPFSNPFTSSLSSHLAAPLQHPRGRPMDDDDSLQSSDGIWEAAGDDHRRLPSHRPRSVNQLAHSGCGAGDDDQSCSGFARDEEDFVLYKRPSPAPVPLTSEHLQRFQQELSLEAGRSDQQADRSEYFEPI